MKAAWFRDAPIGRKLLLIGLLTSGIALFVISLILSVHGALEWRERSLTDMGTYARVIGNNAAPAMMFDDRRTAAEVLSALSANPDIVDAVLYDKNGEVFARYKVPLHPPDMPFVRKGSHLISAGQLIVSEPVQFKGEVLGTLYLESDLHSLYAGLLRDIGLIFLAASAVFLLVTFLFSRLQKTIVSPIVELANAMHGVSSGQDYGVRVAAYSKDEVGMLATTFNTMLERIQIRDVELARHQAHLEGAVAQRTAELVESKRQLEHELAEHRNAEEHTRESEARYRSIFEYADDIIYLLEPDGTFRSLNPSFERITGWSVEEWIGKPFAPIVHPDDLPNANGIFGKALGGESTPTFRLRIARKSGEYFDADLSITPLGHNAVTGALGIARDVTERRQMEERIERLNEELEIKVQERTKQLLETQEALLRKEKLAVLGQVAGSVGHELRNPLGVMSNAVYFLQTVLPDADETTREYLGIIKSEIANSERIVSDLLDSVRTKPPHAEIVGVMELINQTLHKLTIPPSVSVKLDIPETLPPLWADAQQIHQVLRNLISNSAEAMPEGGVLEICAVENKPDGTIAVSVRDSGSGITPEQLGKLFQPLFTTKARGIGLGLVVVKNLTQANGGTVEVQSEVGKGTVFTVILPSAKETI